MQGFSRSKDEAVSPVIGTILIIALTIVIVGIFASVLLGYNAGEPAPILGISIGQEGNIITVTHLNGAVLPAGTYKILVDGVEKDFGATGIFSPGMTLRWDSGTEAVGTVSVVYTGTDGGETVLMQKTIGKAGSGGSGESGGGGDLSILHANGHTYTLSNYYGQWSEFKEIVSGTISGRSTPDRGEILYEDGKYWFVYDPCWVSKENASDSTYTVQDFNNYIISPSRWYPCMIEILKDESVLTSADFSSGTTFKPEVLPLELGKLYTDGTDLYMYNYIDPTSTDKLDHYTPPSTWSTWEWVNIGTISSS